MAPRARNRVVVATRNRGKLAEIRGALDMAGWLLVTAEELGCQPPDVVEDGATFTDNALIKAESYRVACGMPALADDSGLIVDALGGEPGVLSARYAGPDASDSENCDKLLAALEGVPDQDRTARFACAVVYMDERGMPTAGHGYCEGFIGDSPRGTGGFGYDPIFRPSETPGRTMAELGPTEKNVISHRGRALRSLREKLLEARDSS